MIRIFLILACYLIYGNFSYAFDNLLIFSLINIAFYSFLRDKKISFNDLIIFISSTFIIELFLGLPLFISVVALSLPLIAISYFVNNFSIHFSFISTFLFILSLVTFYFLYPEIFTIMRMEDYIYYFLILICLNIGLRLDGKKNKASIDSIKILNRRSFIISAISLILSLIVSIRLFSLQILNFSFYQKKSVENKVSVKATPPIRGDIFDSEKNLVAANASLYEFVLYKNLNKNYLDEVNKLDKLINLDLNISSISEKLKLFNAYTPFILSRANWKQIVEFEKNKFLFTSIKIIESKKRYYPYKNLSQIIGYMGKSSDAKELYSKGIFHLEKTYDEHLKGKPGKIFNEVNSRGKVIREIAIEEPIKGNSLNLTINLKLQNFAQSSLPLTNKGSIVVLNRFDGSILSMNSNPTYDAQVFEDRQNDTINSLLNDPEKPLLNRAFTGFYPPGSVFKPIPALLGLKKNIISENTEIFCTGSTSLADRNYYCWKKGGHGRVNLKKAIKESCDCYFYELAKKINIDDLSNLATALGLNNLYKIGLSNAQKGLVPNKKMEKVIFRSRLVSGGDSHNMYWTGF